MTPCNVMLVDDNLDELTALKYAFAGRKDICIYTAHNGYDGLKILSEKNICIVISDQSMPGMSGVEFLDAVARHFPDTLRIMLTGFYDFETAMIAINVSQVFNFMTKPWNDSNLNRTIDLALDYIQLRNKNREMICHIRDQNTELKDNRDWILSILKSVGEGIITTNFEGKVTFLNTVAETFTGYRIEEALQKDIADIFYILDTSTKLFMKNPIPKLLQEGLVQKNYKNVLMVNKNGVEIRINFKISPIVDGFGTITNSGVVIVFHDKDLW